MAKYINHYEHDTRLYNIWRGMKQRCENPNNQHYKRYGGRGIKLCKKWHDYIPFMLWAISNGYRDDLSIDRINNDGNYSPQNCRWADNITQETNKGKGAIRLYEINGETHSISEWSRITGISRRVITSRADKHYRGEDLIKPPRTPKYYEINGEKHTVSEWARITGLSRNTIETRALKGYEGEELIMPPLPRQETVTFRPKNCNVQHPSSND